MHPHSSSKLDPDLQSLTKLDPDSYPHEKRCGPEKLMLYMDKTTVLENMKKLVNT
jgi:hypothetical protein